MEYTIDVPSFKALLSELEGSAIRLRTRASGEPWGRFASVILLSENAMILQDGEERRTIINLRNVIEFELDKPLRDYREKTTYVVRREA